MRAGCTVFAGINVVGTTYYFTARARLTEEEKGHWHAAQIWMA